jgi:hypothetical protein
MSALGHKRTSTTTGLRQVRRPQERASTLMGDNPRHYGFNDSLDELPAMVHYSAHGRLTKCQRDPGRAVHSSTLKVPGSI